MSKTKQKQSFKRELAPAERRAERDRAAERRARLERVREAEEYGHRPR